jgi:hypothetical protein
MIHSQRETTIEILYAVRAFIFWRETVNQPLVGRVAAFAHPRRPAVMIGRQAAITIFVACALGSEQIFDQF